VLGDNLLASLTAARTTGTCGWPTPSSSSTTWPRRCDNLTLFLIDWGQLPHLPLSLQDLQTAGEPAAAYATLMKALEQEAWALLHAAPGQQERKETLDQGQVDTTLQVGDHVVLLTKELLSLVNQQDLLSTQQRLALTLRPRWEGPFPISVAALAGPNIHLPFCALQMQPHGQRQPAQVLSPSESPGPTRSTRPGL
jgi:hypothetical protein